MSTLSKISALEIIPGMMIKIHGNLELFINKKKDRHGAPFASFFTDDTLVFVISVIIDNDDVSVDIFMTNNQYQVGWIRIYEPDDVCVLNSI